MTENSTPSNLDLARIIDSAQRLGIELNEADALQWLTSIAAGQDEGDVVFDGFGGSGSTGAVGSSG